MPFIVFEGLDGCGKSTQMELLREKLERLGVDVVMTREPGGTPLGEELRSLLLRVEGTAPVPRCELLIYEASRAQHVEQVIRPALESGRWVLSDRFTASTVAFQAAGRQLEEGDISWLNSYATADLPVDLTIFVDVSVQESEKRKSHREKTLGQTLDRFEQEKRDFHQAVYESYHQQLGKEKNWLRVDGEQSVAEVSQDIWEEVEGRKWLES